MNTTTYRPTWAEIDLSAVRDNFQELKKIIDSSTKVMVVVKANAYGHGINEISQLLEDMGVDYLGVATVDEAIQLRKDNIKVPILILGSVLPCAVEAAIKYDLTLTVCNQELATAFDKEAKLTHKVARAHIKVDTGMGRIGVWHEEAVDFVKKVARLKHLYLEGIYTHFSSVARDKFFTRYQIDSFKSLLEKFHREEIDISYKHAASTIALIDFKEIHLNMVRPGMIIYGIYPKKSFSKIVHLRPALNLKTRIVYLKDTPAGRSISYGRTYITQKDTKIATLPIGYADGYGRILSNRAQVLIRGQRAPVVGKVTMDQTMVDVGHIKGVSLGDEVVLIGKQGESEIRAEEIARLSGTIPYEIMACISSRVPRIYKNEERI